ncbi:unnamed protein product, partial [Meganyctiphanes norvegica]
NKRASNMNPLIVLTVLGVATAFPHIPDTPEVAAAKAQFFASYQRQAAAAAAAPDIATHPQQVAHPNTFGAFAQKWTGPTATNIPAGVQGINQVPDTADVQAATNAFLAAYQAQLSAVGGVQQASPAHHMAAPHHAAPVTSQRWTGPLAATIPAGVQGSLAQVPDTAEVQAAAAAHFAAHQAALRSTGGAVIHSSASAPVQRWTGPVAATIPAGVVGSTNQVAETADVAAAKAAHFAAYQQALVHAG